MAGEWIPEKARGLVARFFPGDWEDKGGDMLEGRCPGEDRHSHGGARTDCRVFLGYGPQGQPPGIYCLHKSCGAVLEEMNRGFREALFTYDGETGRARPKDGEQGVVRREPMKREPWIPAYDEDRLRTFVRAVPHDVDENFFMERSPVDVRGLAPGGFLEAVFRPGDRILIFTSFYSQGEYLWAVGKGGYRLASREGTKAVPSKLPTDGGKDGIWFLSNPVDGLWHDNPRRMNDGAPRRSRRSEEAVTSWRYMVIESDDAPADLWLRFLAAAQISIAAIYSSGKRSWHALLRVDQPDKPSFDAFLHASAKRILPRFGADPGAMTPVRLTRLPSCTRGGREQKLIYLNPKVCTRAPSAVMELPKLRNCREP